MDRVQCVSLRTLVPLAARFAKQNRVHFEVVQRSIANHRCPSIQIQVCIIILDLIDRRGVKYALKLDRR